MRVTIVVMLSRSVFRAAIGVVAALVAAAAAASGAQEPSSLLLQGTRAFPERLAALGGQGAVLVEPRPGLRLRLLLERRPEFGIGVVWTGKVEGDPYSFAHLRQERGGMSGRIRTATESFTVVARGPGRVLIAREEDTPPLPDLALPLPESLRGASRPAPRATAPTSESAFDVLVILDRQAAAESPLGMPLVIDLVKNGIVELNTALRDSGVNAQARLVKIKRDSYAPEGSDITHMENMLDAVTDPRDAYFRRAQKWRDRFGADFVAVVSRKNTELCGLAWVAGERQGVQPEDEASAYSVTSWRCLQQGTLAHEIGHNMGLQHARQNPTSSRWGAYDFSFGYLVEPKFATVMAYTCALCTDVLYFSNPDVTVDGVPAGVAGGSEPAANAWSIERDREVMAAFRPCRRNCGS